MTGGNFILFARAVVRVCVCVCVCACVCVRACVCVCPALDAELTRCRTSGLTRRDVGRAMRRFRHRPRVTGSERRQGRSSREGGSE